MKQLFLLSVVFLLALTSCDKETLEAANPTVVEGEYTGTFIRIHPTARYTLANVTLNLSGNRFSGTSDTRNYPAICSGKLEVNNQKLVVTNECFFTADFDGTLILNGQYDYEVTRDTLHIKKTYSPGIYDWYRLTKK